MEDSAKHGSAFEVDKLPQKTEGLEPDKAVLYPTLNLDEEACGAYLSCYRALQQSFSSSAILVLRPRDYLLPCSVATQKP